MRKLIKEQEFELKEDSLVVKQKAPVMTKWKGVDMIRVHSLRATVNEILSVAEVLDVVKVGIIGDQSTGKSTLEDTLAHLIHKMSPIPWAIRSFGEKEFLNMEDTLAKLAEQPTNYILKFRDLSFLTAVATKKQIDIVKNIITKIRHLPGGKDVKIILIYDYHYTLGLDKYLRQANFRYFTSVGSSEEDNMLKIVGNKYQQRVEEFIKLYVEMTGPKHTATFRISPTTYHIYSYKNPFVPCLFWNNSKLRYVVFPKRTWIDPICSLCSLADNQGMESEISLEQFIKESEAKFSKPIFQAIVKLKLFTSGYVTYSSAYASAIKYLDRALEKKLISLEELAVAYDLKIRKTKLRKKLDGVLS